MAKNKKTALAISAVLATYFVLKPRNILYVDGKRYGRILDIPKFTPAGMVQFRTRGKAPDGRMTDYKVYATNDIYNLDIRKF